MDVLTYGEHAISRSTIGAVLFENPLTHVKDHTVIVLIGASFVVPNVMVARFRHDPTFAVPYATL